MTIQMQNTIAAANTISPVMMLTMLGLVISFESLLQVTHQLRPCLDLFHVAFVAVPLQLVEGTFRDRGQVTQRQDQHDHGVVAHDFLIGKTPQRKAYATKSFIICGSSATTWSPCSRGARSHQAEARLGEALVPEKV
jgi:hypothetical protein